MHKVQITKEGLVCNQWDSDIRGFKKITPSSWLYCLQDECTIDPDVTLGNIFDAVDKNLELMMFISKYSHCPVYEFHEEAKKPSNAKSVDRLVISVYFEYHLYGKDMSDANLCIGFSGEVDKDTNSYAMEFTPVNEMVDVPVILRNKCKIFDGNGKEIAEADYTFNFLEVLNAIYWEISWNGGPDSRDIAKEELLERKKEAEEVLSNEKEGRGPGDIEADKQTNNWKM